MGEGASEDDEKIQLLENRKIAKIVQWPSILT